MEFVTQAGRTSAGTDVRGGMSPRRMVLAALAAVGAACLALFLILGAGAPRAALPAPAPGSETASGFSALPAGAREATSAAIGASDAGYSVRGAAAGLWAQSPAQHLQLSFDRSGVGVASGATSLHLALVSADLGAGARALPAASPQASGNRVSYDRRALVEWYSNGPLGLEQGFTIPRAQRRGASALALRFALSGSSRATLLDAGTAVELSSTAGPALVYGHLAAADARGRSLPATLSLAHGALILRVRTAGAAFPVHIDPLVQQGGKLVGEGQTGGTARQGWSVALSANGNTAAVGGPGDNVSTGAVWIFTRSGSTWSQQGPKLTGAGEVGSGRFGTAVALSANGDTLAVGGESDASNKGAAWVFTRSGTTWSQQGGKLTGTGETGSGRVGVAVSLSGDGNTLLTGGWSDSTNLGAAWVFVRAAGTWTQQGGKLTPKSGEEIGKGEFGERAAISEDGATAILGAPGDNANVGAAWVFTRSGTTWSQQGGKLTGAGETGAGRFAGPVALSADGSTALIGGRSDNANLGAGWVFTRSGTTWSQQGGKLTPTGESGAGEFGWSAALSASGDLALLGAPADNGSTGAAWEFSRTGSSWSQLGGKLTGTGESGPGEFGVRVTLSAEGHTALIGGQADAGSGAAWVFQATLPNAVTGAASGVGASSADVAGTVNPDGEALSECTFEYGPSEAYGSSAPCSALPGEGTSPVPVSAHLSGLAAGTTYHFRLLAGAAGGVSRGADGTFTTTPGLPPAATTGAASGVTQAHAQIAGTVDPRGEVVSACRVEYGLTGGYGSSAPCSSLPGGGNGAVAVTAALSGLSPASEYHYRLAATNPSGTSYGLDGTFITPAASAPAAETGAASGLAQFSASVGGQVNPEDEALSDCRFEYGTSEAYGASVPCSTLPGPGASPVAVSAQLVGLEAGVTYHFRLAATNGTGTGRGADATFTTPARQAPAISGEQASPVAQATATLRASVNPEDEAVTECRFEYGSSEAYGLSVPCQSLPPAGSEPVAVSAAVEGLAPGTTYHFRLVAVNGTGTAYGLDASFATNPLPPVAFTGGATSVTQHTAAIEGTVDPRGAAVTSCRVEYGTSEAYGASAPCASIPPAASEPVAVAAGLSGLSPGTTYHYRVAASNAGGTGYGADALFTTVVEAPSVATLAPAALGQTSATLRATVNPRGGTVGSCSFEYGTSEAYGSTVACSSLPGSGTSPVTVSAPVASLSAGTIYHFRVLASNAGGSSTSSDSSFATPAPALPEIGRCLAIPGKAVGRYSTSTCTTFSAGQNTGKYEWSPWPAAHNAFSVVGPVTYLETTGKARLTCRSNRLTGEFAGPKAIVAQVAFEGCEGSAGFSGKCQTAGAAPGEILTTTLNGNLGVIKAGSVPTVGFDILPPAGHPFAEFMCGPIPLTVGGSVIAPIIKVNKMSTTFTLNLKASRGKQVPEKLEGEPKDTLVMTALGHEEGVGITFEDLLTTQEAIEIKANP